jgi:hypothetical protein
MKTANSYKQFKDLKPGDTIFKWDAKFNIIKEEIEQIHRIGKYTVIFVLKGEINPYTGKIFVTNSLGVGEVSSLSGNQFDEFMMNVVTEERFYTTEEECKEKMQTFIFRQIQSMEDKAKHLRGLYEKKEGRN